MDSDQAQELQNLIDAYATTLLEQAGTKVKIEKMVEEAYAVAASRRAEVDQEIAELQPTVALDLATDEDQVEYVLLLNERADLDRQMYELTEAAGQLNLPNEDVETYEEVSLEEGVNAFYNSSVQEET